MNKLLQSTLGTLILLALLVLAVVQVWQLDRIEARLAQGVPTTVASAPAAQPSNRARSAADCTGDAWWQDDLKATAEPGNLLKMHTRCKVRAETVVRGGSLRRVWGSDPNGLNAYGDGGNSADVREIYRYVSGRLADRDVADESIWHPELAQSVLLVDDGDTGQVMTVRLRKGVYWQAPDVDLNDPKYAWLAGDHEFTADDYLFIFDNILDPTVAVRFAVLRADFAHLVKAEKVDRYTFKLTFNKRRHATLGSVLLLEPAPAWLYGFDEAGHPLDRATFGETFPKHWYNQKAIGMGPYQFKEWRQGESITLVKNPRYWGETPSFDSVRLQIIKDKAGWPRALQNQELDFVHLLPAQYRTTVLDAKGGPIFGDPHVKWGLNDQYAYFYIGWNRKNPRLQDKHVRQALSMAIDRQGLLDNVYYGLGQLISGPLTPAHACYDKSVAPWPYDPQAAAKLLDDAGWIDTNGDGVREKVVDGKTLDLKLTMLLYGSSEEWATIGNQFKEAYRRIGVALDPLPLEWATMQQRMKERDFDAYSGSWVMDSEYDPRALWHSESADVPGSINYIAYRDPQMDAMIEDYEADFDEERRLKTCFRMHEYLHEDEPYTFLFARRTPVLWWDWMNDLEMFASNPNRDLRYYSFNTKRD